MDLFGQFVKSRQDNVRALAASKNQFLQSAVNQTVTMLPGERLKQSSLAVLFLLLVLLAGGFATLFRSRIYKKRKALPPAVPGGLPLLGNLLQLKSLRPHKTLTNLSEKFGPIYQLNLGSLKYVVITSPELAKEVGVTKYELVSKRNLLSNLKVWSIEQHLVALLEYGDEYRQMKKILSSQLLGSVPQKSLSVRREKLLENVVNGVHFRLEGSSGLVNIRESIKQYIFPFVMRQVLGYVPESVYVPELGHLELWGIFDHLVSKAMRSAVAVDWRDFVPLFKWIPNPAFEKKVVQEEKLRSFVLRALMEQKRQRLETQGPEGGFLEHVWTVETNLSNMSVKALTWEPILEGSDTSLVSTEWAMYELAKNQDIQERVYQEIQMVVGSRAVTERDLPNLPLLDAVLKETLRLHCPVPLLPPREVVEDINIGGYHISKGWQILVNVYGINNDKKRWDNWEKWIPDRFMNAPELDLGVNNFQLIPFGLGKRRCAGTIQATTMVTSFVAAYVQHFHFRLPDMEYPSVFDNDGYVITQMFHPLEVIARARNSQVQHPSH